MNRVRPSDARARVCVYNVSKHSGSGDYWLRRVRRSDGFPAGENRPSKHSPLSPPITVRNRQMRFPSTIVEVYGTERCPGPNSEYSVSVSRN